MKDIYTYARAGCNKIDDVSTYDVRLSSDIDYVRILATSQRELEKVLYFD